MIVDIGDPLRNLILNACLYGIAVISVVSLVPWPIGGGRNRWTLYLPLVGIGLYLAYEVTMPPNWDIRLDLLLILAMGAVIVLSWLVRLLIMRRHTRP